MPQIARNRPASLALILALLGSIQPTSARGVPDDPAISPDDRAFFEAKVRPILVEHCYSCHSADAKKLRGGLYLDTREGVLKGGDTGPAVVPGNLDESLLIEAIRYEDAANPMPPKGKLADAEIAALEEWVRRGVPDPRAGPAKSAVAEKSIDLEAGRKHWAFQPLKVAPPPPMKDGAWGRNPIDRFILQGLEDAGLAPNPEAGRRALARRLALDLTGLPPDPAVVDAFVASDDPDAYDRLITKYLDAPQFGERWARHWLDLARWAESHGFEHDYDRPTAYHYRDFVVEALNRDLPFDTFAKWQVAGDEFAPDDNLALKATGFLAAGTHSTQITANQVEKERYDELDDMLHTAGTAFLGLTFGCARCHDHKFDPIPQRDYYRMLSTFTTTVRSEVELKLDPERDRKARERYDREHGPYVEALAAFESDQLPGRLDRWEASRSAARHEPAEWVVLQPGKVTSKGGAKVEKLPDDSVRFADKNPDFDTYTIAAACDLPRITAVKIEALADESLPRGGPGRAANGNFALTGLTLTIGPRYGIGQTVPATLTNPKATFEQAGLPIAAAIDGDEKSGWAVDPKFGEAHAAVFELSADVLPDGGATLNFTLDFQNNARHNLGRVRVSATGSTVPVGLGPDDDGLPAAIRPILATPKAERTADQKAALLSWYKTIDPEWRSLNKTIEEHARTEPKATVVKAMISTEGLPAVRLHTQGGDFLEKTHFLRRGDPNQKVEEVDQGFLRVLMDDPEGEDRWQEAPPEGWRTSYRRRAFANWMTDTEHGAGVLLARVIVNRVWQHHMGRGIVATPSDFGTQGEPPSHPELLDWLAVELIQNGWHLKPIHRLILESATYRQASDVDPAKTRLDPDNAKVWRFPRRRLEAEAIRDSMLAVSGKLDPRMGGPGSLDERMTRRSLYFTVKRSRLIPMMMAFDAPDGLTAIAARAETTVAPQSLLVLNSPIVRGWARALAHRVRPRPEIPLEKAVTDAYRLALARPPSDEEKADALTFLAAQASTYRDAGRAGDADEAALTDLGLVLFGLNEFLTIE